MRLLLVLAGLMVVACGGARSDPYHEPSDATVDVLTKPPDVPCGGACGAGTICRNQLCTPDFDAQTEDAVVDALACGVCDFPHARTSCVNGICSLIDCLPGFADCDRGARNGCEVDTNSTQNCGGCGRVCGAGAFCVREQCVAVDAGWRDVELETGALSDASVVLDVVDANPNGGCPVGFADCDHDARNGCEADLASPTSCGACGNGCGTGYTCVDGACRCLSPRVVCGGVCSDTRTDSTRCGSSCARCATGSACADGQCVPMCRSGLTRCPVPGGDTCANLSSDQYNCGACGRRCEAGFMCSLAACVPCAAGTTWCDGACVDVSSDRNHCGACGAPCAMAPAGLRVACVAGVCTITNCEAGTADCDRNVATGCEVSLSSPRHCGACGNQCPSGMNCTGSTPTCTCQSPTRLCGGRCVSPLDPAHCGRCDNACLDTEVCTPSGCLFCGIGRIRCGADCVDPLNDHQNCGRCGNVCGSLDTCLNGNCRRL